MSEKIIFAASIIFGTVGGIAWSELPPADPAKPPVARPVADVIPAASQPAPRTDLDGGVYYSGCNEVRALGKAPLLQGQPGYRPEMDGDGDGIACEPHRRG